MAALLGVASISFAQRVGPGEPLTLVVGPSPGESVTDRLDGRRTSASRDPLPMGSLRILWARQLPPASHPPVVASDGSVVVVDNQGRWTS